MSEPSSVETQTEVVRLQRALEEVLERSAGHTEAERIDALAQALRGPVASMPAATRTAALVALESLYEGTSGVGSSARLRELEADNARLREALAASQVTAPAPAPITHPGGLGIAVAEVLLGSDRDAAALFATDPGAEQRLQSVIRVLTTFVSELVRSYLSVTGDPDRTMAGRLNSVLADEVKGTVAAGSVASMVAQIRQQIGGQILAFREACDSGARDLLRQLGPPALAAGSAQGGMRVLGARPFYYRECWENFEKKYEELRTADNLYETYFDGAFRKALHRAGRAAEPGKGKR